MHIQCLWAPLGFALGAQYMVQWEVRQEGLQWANMHLMPGTDDQLSFMSVSLILCLDTLLYFMAVWYIEGVAPGRYGVAKPLYFPFMPSYWLGQKGRGWFKKQEQHELLADGKSIIHMPQGAGSQYNAMQALCGGHGLCFVGGHCLCLVGGHYLYPVGGCCVTCFV